MNSTVAVNATRRSATAEYTASAAVFHMTRRATSMHERSIRTHVKEPLMELLKMMRIVFWSFFGVRKRASHNADFAHVKLPLLPVIAVMLAGAFGLTLLTVAKLATGIAH
jgi:nitrate reductase NapE component